MFGASLQPAAPGHRSVSPRLGTSHDVMESPTAPRRSERLERTIENELVPRLLASHRAGPVPPALSMAMARELSERDVDGFVAAVRSLDDSRAVQFLRDILAEGATVEAVYLDLLAPSARRLGQMWDNDECDFVEVTVSLGRMQRMLRDLSQVFLADATRSEPVGSVLLTCIPGEQHTLGIIMVGEFLLRDGWRVLVGAPWSESDLLTMVGTEWFDVIGFSVGSESRLPLLKRDIRRLKSASRNPHLQCMVGGQVFSDDPTLADQVGANAIAGDAREAPQIARRLLDAAQRAASDAPLREALGDHGQFSDALRRE
ncbi:cobalamin B12-binding domain-containing protein [Gemmatimonas sp.]|uniref:cobalamin B12-binding domain-containing protein n=1 Tax=Gemmatimonas sp. TaxID=1962908 RepID=UPI00286DA584|nr:cobalamin B12-binding domain-containing protein [Gemmatimonas sp.]